MKIKIKIKLPLEEAETAKNTFRKYYEAGLRRWFKLKHMNNAPDLPEKPEGYASAYARRIIESHLERMASLTVFGNYTREEAAEFLPDDVRDEILTMLTVLPIRVKYIERNEGSEF